MQVQCVLKTSNLFVFIQYDCFKSEAIRIFFIVPTMRFFVRLILLHPWRIQSQKQCSRQFISNMWKYFYFFWCIFNFFKIRFCVSKHVCLPEAELPMKRELRSGRDQWTFVDSFGEPGLDSFIRLPHKVARFVQICISMYFFNSFCRKTWSQTPGLRDIVWGVIVRDVRYMKRRYWSLRVVSVSYHQRSFTNIRLASSNLVNIINRF